MKITIDTDDKSGVGILSIKIEAEWADDSNEKGLKLLRYLLEEVDPKLKG
jgi:hypothetical protein